MAYSIQTAVSDGTLEVLDLSIKYMDKSHIFVYVDDVLVDGSAYSYVWLTDTRIQVVPAVANGSTLKVIRKTLTDEMWHEFSKGARFSTTSMDENFEQLLFLAQEYSEGIYVADFYTDIDVHLKRVLNLGNPVNDGDAVNLRTLKEYLPNADLLPSLVSRIEAEEANSEQLALQGIPTGDKVILGFDGSTLPNNAWVHFSGYSTIGDGGGGHLRFLKDSTAAADGVTVYAITGGRLVRENWLATGVNPLWAGAKGDGVSDDTAAIQATLNIGAEKVIIPAGHVFGVTSLVMSPDQTIQLDGSLKKLSGAGDVLSLNNQCRIIGTGEIDGNSIPGASGINASGKSDVIVDGIYIHHCGGKGINLTSTTKYKICNNRIENITAQAVNLEFADDGSVYGNYIDTALHGIQFWGGDASTAPGTYTYDIAITGNVVKNVTGGIWGSQGQRVAVTGNTITICSDVGIDFEGCSYCTACGNSVSKCNNGGISLFYASTFCTLNGNSILVDATSGNKYGIWFTAAANSFNVVSNNTINVTSTSSFAMYFDAGGRLNTVDGNAVFGYGSGSTASVRVLRQMQMTISNNKLVDCKLRLEGSGQCHVYGNHIYRNAAADAATQTDSPLYIYWSDATWPAQENTVTNNLVQNWQYSIVDDCWGDNLSLNDCSYNRVSGSMYHRGTSGWYGRMQNNITFSNPNVGATVSTY